MKKLALRGLKNFFKVIVLISGRLRIWNQVELQSLAHYTGINTALPYIYMFFFMKKPLVKCKINET